MYANFQEYEDGYYWYYDGRVIEVQNGEVILSRSTYEDYNSVHKIGEPRWDIVEKVFDFCFKVSRTHFDKMITQLSNESQGKKIAVRILETENIELQKQIQHNKDLVG